ncbi:hypothetical protein NPIL_530131 [Nephila pilipes]|uniref:Uncharacterized protein n=1 Tax=Nephila pilipes TaxID=299642 RepID=A0A8X6T2R8_NEPPI|nr:hypothetical protein NPIL_530131 [Nephila pilipes]
MTRRRGENAVPRCPVRVTEGLPSPRHCNAPGLTLYKILMAGEIEKLGRFNLVEGLFLKFWWDPGGGGGNESSGERGGERRKREFLLTVSERERKARS